MSVIFLARGTATIGMIKRDADGKVIEQTPAQFTIDGTGGSVGIGTLDPETMKPTGLECVYGDWDAAAYLAKVLEMMKPDRPINIPDFRGMIHEIAIRERVDICEYCHNAGYNCRDCIITEWRNEDE